MLTSSNSYNSYNTILRRNGLLNADQSKGFLSFSVQEANIFLRALKQTGTSTSSYFFTYIHIKFTMCIFVFYSWHKSWAKNVEYIQTHSANDTTGNCSSFKFLLPPYQSQWIEPLAFSDKPASSKAAWHLYHCEVGTQGPKISVGKKHFMKFMPWVAVQLLFMLWSD